MIIRKPTTPHAAARRADPARGSHKRPRDAARLPRPGLRRRHRHRDRADGVQPVREPARGRAALSPDLEALRASCGIATQGAGKIPFICFDLAGGANMAGSNVLVGGAGGQLDFLTTAGYGQLGLPGDMVPDVLNAATGTSFIDTAPRPRLPLRQRVPARHPGSQVSPAHRGEHQRRGDRRRAPRTIPATTRTTRCTASPGPARTARC